MFLFAWLVFTTGKEQAGGGEVGGRLTSLVKEQSKMVERWGGRLLGEVARERERLASVKVTLNKVSNKHITREYKIFVA